MNIERDLRDALRRKAAPRDLADRVMARIERGEAARDDASGKAGGKLLPIAGLGGPPELQPRRMARRYDSGPLASGAVRFDRRASWLVAAAAAVLVATGAAQYYTQRATAAEAERVQQDIQIALRITSEKLALVQERVERTTQDSAR